MSRRALVYLKQSSFSALTMARFSSSGWVGPCTLYGYSPPVLIAYASRSGFLPDPR